MEHMLGMQEAWAGFQQGICFLTTRHDYQTLSTELGRNNNNKLSSPSLSLGNLKPTVG